MEHLRRIFLSGGRLISRQSRSSFQPRRVEFTPQLNPNSSSQGNGPRLLRPFLFTLGFSGSCFTMAAIWEYEDMRSKALEFKQRSYGWVQKKSRDHKLGDFRNHLNIWWQNISPADVMFYGILFANTLVFLAWKIPSMQNFMSAFFCTNPFARAVCWPMFFSTFSHYSWWHFGVNMFVLHSFTNVAMNSMGKEQFLAFYLSAGIFSSLGSHVFRTISRTPGLSLGASGAIMGILGYFCSLNPDALLQVAFVPQFTFTADSGLKALLCFDTFGLLMRWKMFDHAAHLGGVLFGLFWFYFGQQNIWKQRIGLLQIWHNFRNGTGPRE
nr:EOG090X07NR [Eurycercus lamellatus]